MREISRYIFEVTTDTLGAGTAVSTYPLSGLVEEIRCQSGFGGTAGTADFTFTRSQGGGTILVVTDGTAPWSRLPRAQIADTTGTAVSGVYDSIPIDDYVQMLVAQGGSVVAGTVSFYYTAR